MSRKHPSRVLSKMAQKPDNKSMEQLLKTLREIGLPDAEVERLRRYYRDDEPGLRQYVTYMRALMDDRHEYI